MLSGALAFGANAQNEESFQFSFITPMGTNGVNSHQMANNVSINLLGGYSRGNNAFECAGLYNINSEYTKGAQFAGITNISGKSENAYQFAGIANVNSDQKKGGQFAGIANVASEGKVDVQVSGILNYAKYAGTQIGLINIADSVSGVPVGLINIVKKNGKQEFELGFSDALNTYLSFKLGTDKFYTIFSGGVNYFDIKNGGTKDPIQYAAGLGFGTDRALKNNFSTQIEVMGYALTEDKSFAKDLNMLTQLKLTAAKELSSGIKFYAGPVFNMTVSQLKNTEGKVIGAGLAPYTLFDNKGEKTNLEAWVGFTFGIRY